MTTSALEARTMRKVTWRIVPYLGLLYFISFLDRANVGFAALTMNKALGLTATMFGFGTGIFFFGYLLFEVPSNLALARFGARRWITRIMITWGIISGAMAFSQGEYSFYTIRFLLGLAEAGFFPGILLYLTYWFPASYRGKIIGLFMVAIPVSGIIGPPVSGLLFGFDGVSGMAGWQWMFIIEAAPALVLGVVTLFYLTDRPALATWLEPEERRWLQDTLDREERHRETVHRAGLVETLLNPRIWALSLVYFGPVVGLYGITFWLPQIVKEFGLATPLQVGLVSAIPPLVGAFGMVLWSRHSDKTKERTWHVVAACFVGAAGFVLSGYLPSPVLRMASLSIAALGIYAALPVFWTLPTAFLSGAAAAGGIALINSLGNIGGYAGPFLLGFVKDQTNSFSAALLTLAGLMVLAGIVALCLGHNRVLEESPHAAAGAD
ncbi:MAG TPA: MFS transporter [Stellaceae bacterium]|nr:MFS transporter [Stellaceae bacterium]